MRNLKIDASTGGFVIAGGALQFVEDAAAVAQAVRCELRTFAGEYFLDRSRGVPYLAAATGKGRNPYALGAVVKAAILGVPGMRSVDSMNFLFDKATRSLSIAWTGTTVYGTPLSDTFASEV
jgi:hypothetical protein